MSHREPHAVTTPVSGAVMGMRGCEHAAECTSDRPGHGLNAVQERLAAVTASKWIDAIVTSVDGAGFARLATLDGGIRRVWQHDRDGIGRGGCHRTDDDLRVSRDERRLRGDRRRDDLDWISVRSRHTGNLARPPCHGGDPSEWGYRNAIGTS